MEANGAFALALNTCPDSSHSGGLTISTKRKSDVALEGLHHFSSTNSVKRKPAVVAEQLRRNLMKCLCAKLESLIPTILSKVDRCGLYEEASNYIRKLQEQVRQLKQHRDHLVAKQNCGETVTDVGVEIYGREAVIIISSMRKPRCFWRIIEEVEEHGLDVHMSQLSTSDSFVYIYFHAKFREEIKELHDPVQLQSSLQRKLFMAY